MVAAAENMQAFGRDPFSGNRDSVFLGSGSIAGDELDISSFVVLPGFVDVHVHLREPGFSYKETISSGTLAAAHGGYSSTNVISASAAAGVGRDADSAARMLP